MIEFLLAIIVIIILIKIVYDDRKLTINDYNPHCPAFPFKQLTKIFLDIDKDNDVLNSPIRTPKVEIFNNLQELNIKVVNGELSVKEAWAAHDAWIDKKFEEWREKIPNYDDKAFNQLLSWKENMGNWW